MTSDNQNLDARAFALFERSLKRDRNMRRDWIEAQAGTDTDLRDKTLQLLTSDETEAGILLTGAAVTETYVDETPPDKIGVYKIGEKLGQGGMGTVYRGARDIGDFDHAVAVKLIKPGIISDNLKDRFAHEQQVMAGFSHPNIAHLYDGGTTDEGAPYIIMELIDGVSITDWVHQNRLSEKQCLDIFKTACQAVAYAHQNLIIHRDLTPSNVLVTTDGVVKLIDFGIAKPYDEAAAVQDPAGSLASLSFTPGFAAPERSKGAATNTLSDVYSLGKLLEDILPEGAKSTDLQAIYDKATALLPESRYASVNDLINDIDDYCSGYPVSAHLGGVGYKLRKFVKRNRVATVFGSVAMVGLVGGLVVTTSLYRQAETARQAADARFLDVRNLANTMMFDIYDEIADVPGGTKAEVKLAEAAQEYLDELSTDISADNDLKLETASGFFRLANIQGSPSAGAQKKIKSAKVNLETAEKLLVPIINNNPQNLAAALKLSNVYYALAELAQLSEQSVGAALENIDKSENIVKQARIFAPKDVDLHKEWIRARTLKSAILMKNNEQEKAISLALEIKQDNLDLAKAWPDDKIIQRQVAVSLNNVGRLFYRVERNEEAADLFSEAMIIVEELLLKHPDNELYHRDMAYTLWRRAHANSASENGGEQSIKDFKTAISIMQNLVDKDPSNKNSLVFHNVIKGESMLAYQRLGNYALAEEIGLQYITDSQNLSRQFPDDRNRVRDIMVAKWNLVELYNVWGKEEKACKMLAELFSLTAQMNGAGQLSAFDKDGLSDFENTRKKCAIKSTGL